METHWFYSKCIFFCQWPRGIEVNFTYLVFVNLCVITLMFPHFVLLPPPRRLCDRWRLFGREESHSKKFWTVLMKLRALFIRSSEQKWDSLMFVFDKDKQSMFSSNLSGVKVISSNALRQRNVHKSILNKQLEIAQVVWSFFIGKSLWNHDWQCASRKSILWLLVTVSLCWNIWFDENDWEVVYKY